MKILIVDDDLERAQALKNHLINSPQINQCEVTIAHCMDTAKHQMSIVYYDALVLDVVLPKRAGEKSDQKYGIDLLGQVIRSSKLKRPEKIIGITAHLSDIKIFNEKFSEHCLLVLQAERHTTDWRNHIVNAVSYSAASKISRAVSLVNLNALTIHGIRTFGDWQDRLKQLVASDIGSIGFHSYKYGYFSVIAFFIPRMRELEIRRLVTHLEFLFTENPNSNFIIFSHSFGTYLITHALLDLTRRKVIPVKRLVLCGSVLREDQKWDELHRAGISIVNECCDDDHVLLFSEAMVLGTGMAGKSGFYGVQNEKLINRFFKGGHSSYFQGNDFMYKYWLPLFDVSAPIQSIDQRSSSTLTHEIIDKIASVMGICKRPIYYIAGLALLLMLARTIAH